MDEPIHIHSMAIFADVILFYICNLIDS